MESDFARLRRGEAGHHHHITGAYLMRHVQEAVGREGDRRMSSGEEVERVAHAGGGASGQPELRWLLVVGCLTANHNLTQKNPS